jgi:riboflavin synthase
MFSGIISALGRVRAVEHRGDSRFAIESGYDTASIEIGASIACSGVCLTVADKSADWFAVDASAETLARTTTRDWRPGTTINLERALRVGDELGGHFVSGHVDGVARIIRRRPEGDSLRFVFEAPEEVMPGIAPKGSVALDGVSLTVNEVEGSRFGVNIIPHTAAKTTFGSRAEGDSVNLEIDMLARYVQRLLQKGL